MADSTKPTDNDDAAATAEESLVELSRSRLRQRWELASVLNFFSVFEEIIGEDVKMPAEEIETALINPNASLAKLHIALLKGIPPVNKNLSKPDVWVTILCKKLADWWPWVAEGEIPLTAAKGEEISKYKELDPTVRLQMLKALCELRTEQDDVITYINDALKEGKRPSHFRKARICEDGTGTSYWHDGNSVIGHRLYREEIKSLSRSKHKGKGYLDPPTNIEWETLATNLDEFRNVLEQFSSRKVGVKEAVCMTIETEVIPVLGQLQKKKERALKRQQRQDALLNGHQSFAVGVTRSCRARRPVNYTFAEYDHAIDEALKSTRKRKDREVQRYTRNHQQQQKRDSVPSDGDSEKDPRSEEGSPVSTDGEAEDDIEIEDSKKEDDAQNSDNSEENGSENNESEEANNSEAESSDCDHENGRPNCKNDNKNDSGSSSDDDDQKTTNLGAKNRLRQRPTRNTALESIVSDSDNENPNSNSHSSETVSSGSSGSSEEGSPMVPHSEDEAEN